jgi:hypothetical protein
VKGSWLYKDRGGGGFGSLALISYHSFNLLDVMTSVQSVTSDHTLPVHCRHATMTLHCIHSYAQGIHGAAGVSLGCIHPFTDSFWSVRDYKRKSMNFDLDDKIIRGHS